MTILVVDDSNEVRARFVAMIVEAGMNEVREAGNAARAMEHARARPPRVVLLDLNLPDKTGFFLLEELKAQVAPTPAIVIATNHATDAHRRRCLALGADAFFDKSGDVARIVAVVIELARAG